MVVLILIISVILFILADAGLRFLLKKREQAKTQKEREEALDIGLRLDFTDEAQSLKRVSVDHPKARILAVDDEEVILDSFRKILVIAGYSIDTVETGPEALGLIKKNDYDFVFTDLKMPEMDGVEVTKAVKHLRPDIDVIVITGYATIESAVETMKYGAMDYVQKPFTQDELIDFVNKSQIRRQDRIEKTTKPKVHLITPSLSESKSSHEFNVPAGVFITPGHTWVRIDLNGLVRVGMDDFAQKILGTFDEVTLPEKGVKVKKGDILFSVKQGSRRLDFPAPLSGKVTTPNSTLTDHVEYMNLKPYELGWICNIEPANLNDDLQAFKIGADTVEWYQKEIDKFHDIIKTISSDISETRDGDDAQDMNDEMWKAFNKTFVHKKFD
ncbi:MAG: response regulator [candidate division KSB1 bacterium]|nr:response regulator [candidate division KSB1 bacterium]